MAKDVVLKLQINGVDTSIKNLGELESHLKQLKKDIKGVDLGSEAFNKMQSEIKQTDAKLKEMLYYIINKKNKKKIKNYGTN